MKKIYSLIALVAVLLPTLFLTSCDDYYGPPGGSYDSDPNLVGYWQLTRVNGNPVYGYQSNYLEFFRNGSGNYYYYSYGQPYQMRLNYYVDYYGGSQTIYINYSDGSNVSADYWFNSNYTRLYMQWYEYGRLQTYEYTYADGVYWAPALNNAPAQEAIDLPDSPLGLRPGGALTK